MVASDSEVQKHDALLLARNNKLIRVGVTAGVAAALMVPLAASDGFELKNADMTAVTYVQFLPWYWLAKHTAAKRTYCASAWTAEPRSSRVDRASAAAREEARRWIRVLVDQQHLLQPLNPNGPNGQTKHGKEKRALLVEKSDDTSPTFIVDSEGNKKALQLPAGGLWAVEEIARLEAEGKKAEAEIAFAKLVSAVAATLWEPTKSTSCGGSKFGVWVGLPLPYETRVSGDGVDAERSVKPLPALGVSFTPNAYVSFLVGIAGGSFKAPDTGPRRQVLTFTAGLGGNLDFVGLLLSK